MEVTEEADLTGRAKLAFEASLKIAQGQKLIAEGKLELQNLIGDKPIKRKGAKVVAHKTTRRAVSTFKMEKRTDEQIAAQIEKIVEKNEEVHVNLLHEKLHVSERRLLRVINSMKHYGFVKGAKGHVLKKLTEPGKAAPTKQPKNKNDQFAHEKDPLDEVYNFIKNNDWVTKRMVTEKLGKDFYAIQRCLNTLVRDKKVKTVEKNHNPAHKGSARGAFERVMTYYETT